MTYRALASELAQLGVSEHAYLSEPEILAEMNKLIKKKNISGTFNEDIHAELWEQCSKNTSGQVLMEQYLKTIVQARDILEERLRSNQERIRMKTDELASIEKQIATARVGGDANKQREMAQRLGRVQGQLYDLQEDFKDFDSDLRCLMLPFTRNDVFQRQSEIVQSPILNQNAISFSQVNNTGRLDRSTRLHSQIFFRKSSKTLLILFLLTMSLFFLELLLINHKYHFLTILCALALVAIFGLNYFDEMYIRLVMILLGLSLLLDFIWLFVRAGKVWSPGNSSGLTELNQTWYRFVVLLIVVEMGIKVLISLILFTYRNNREVESVNICGYSVVLSGDPNQNVITRHLQSVFR